MKKSIIYVFVAFILVSLGLGLAIVSPVHGQVQNIKIVSYSYYVDTAGYLDVVGEVQNVGPNTVTSVILTGSIYSSDGTDQSDSYTQIGVDPNPIIYLNPQQYAPFYMNFFTPKSSADGTWLSVTVSNVKLTVVVANATQNYQYSDLKITSSSGSIGTNSGGVTPDKGVYWVNGNLQNTGSQTTQNVTVFGTFYNSTGNVVAVGYGAQIGSLAPSGTTSFKLGAFDLNQTGIPSSEKIASYKLFIGALNPVLQGTAPIITPAPTDTSSSTPSSSNSLTNSPSSTSSPTTSSSTTSSPQSPGNNPANSLNPTLIAIIVVIVVLVVIGSIILLKKRRPQETAN